MARLKDLGLIPSIRGQALRRFSDAPESSAAGPRLTPADPEELAAIVGWLKAAGEVSLAREAAAYAVRAVESGLFTVAPLPPARVEMAEPDQEFQARDSDRSIVRRVNLRLRLARLGLAVSGARQRSWSGHPGTTR